MVCSGKAFAAGALVLAALLGAAVHAVQLAGVNLLSPDAHVRAIDPIARQLLEEALACSPTVAALVSRLQSTDLIVMIVTRPPQKGRTGEFRLFAAAPQTRYGRVVVNVPNNRGELLSALGHELQHAWEVGSTPGVRDGPTLRAFYLRIGSATGSGGFYETDAAVAAGREVLREVGGCRAATR